MQQTSNKQFQFFYSRTCFRGYVEYYKEQMAALKANSRVPKQVLAGINWRAMKPMIEQLLVQEFGLSDLFKDTRIASKQEQSLLVVTMMMVLYTHRHSKDDKFIVEADSHVQELYKQNQ